MKAKQWLIFLLLGAIWSSSFMWIKIAVRELGPNTLVAFRVLFGLLFSIAVVVIQRTRLPRTFKAWLPLLVLGLTNLAIPFLLISWGEQTIDSAVAAILDATVPLFTILMAHFLLPDDKITAPKVLGLVVGFAGIIVLVSRDLGAPAGSLLGQGAVILASLFYAVSAVYARRVTKDTPGIVRSGGPLLSATAVMWASSFLFESPLHVPRLGLTWLALLFLGVVGSGVAFLLLYSLIHEIGPTRATMVTYLFPLGGVVLGVAVLGERLTWQVAAGAALIITSLVIANRVPARKAVKKPARQVEGSEAD